MGTIINRQIVSSKRKLYKYLKNNIIVGYINVKKRLGDQIKYIYEFGKKIANTKDIQLKGIRILFTKDKKVLEDDIVGTIQGQKQSVKALKLEKSQLKYEKDNIRN